MFTWEPYLDGLFSLGKAAAMGCFLSLHIRYEIGSLLGLIFTEKKDFNQKSSYLSANTLLLGRQSSFQSVPGSSHTCPGLLLSTKINSTSKSQEMHMTGST